MSSVASSQYLNISISRRLGNIGKQQSTLPPTIIDECYAYGNQNELFWCCVLLSHAKTDVLDDGDAYGSNRDLSQFCMLLFHVNIYLWKIGKYIEAAINSLNAVCCFFP